MVRFVYDTMKNLFLVALSLLILSPIASFGQKKKVVEEPNTGLTVNLFGHTYGYGVGVDWFRTAGNKDFFVSVDIASYRSKREQKVESAYADQNGKDYIFDKKNYFYVISPKVGLSKQFASASHFNRIGVRGFVMVGPSIGILKPYYVEIAVPIGGNLAKVDPQPFDAANHTYFDIVGEADYFFGMDELSVVGGVSMVAGATIDFSSSTEYIRGLKISANVDLFSSTPEILDTFNNKQIFVGGTVGLVFGNAWKSGK